MAGVVISGLCMLDVGSLRCNRCNHISFILTRWFSWYPVNKYMSINYFSVSYIADHWHLIYIFFILSITYKAAKALNIQIFYN